MYEINDEPEPHESVSYVRSSTCEERMGNVETVSDVLTKVSTNLASSSKKLANVHMLIMHLRSWDSDHDDFFPISFEKALEFDLLSGILDSEVIEVGQVMERIEEEIAATRDNVFSCRSKDSSLSDCKEKMQCLVQSLSKCMAQFEEVKMQSTKLQRTFSDFRTNMWNSQIAVNFAPVDRISKGLMIWKKLTAEQQFQALKLYEKSLSRELDFEKQLYEARRSEEQIKSKMKHVTFWMEETSEVIWGRFLEAENRAEVFSGTTKELVDRLKMAQLYYNGSFQRELMLKSQLQSCLQRLEDKDKVVTNLERSIAERDLKLSQVPMLMDKIGSLEEQLRKYELHVKNTISLNGECQEQLLAMENILDSLKASLNEAEARAEAAEVKAAELTESNLELTEELNDVKSSRDADLRKTSLLETQVRELEIQLQHSKASAEANQEQQNMLYSAIWDMETLIEDLKSRNSMADIKAEAAEEHCKRLSNTNLDLHTEISFLKSKVSMLEESLLQAEKEKSSCAREINLKSQLLMDTVMQLTKQRESIQSQLYIPTKKKSRKLVDKYTGSQNDICAALRDNENHKKVALCSEDPGVEM